MRWQYLSILSLLTLLCAGASTVWAQERQYLVAGKNNALPDASAITAAGGGNGSIRYDASVSR
jgi:hypothetical protein